MFAAKKGYYKSFVTAFSLSLTFFNIWNDILH